MRIGFTAITTSLAFTSVSFAGLGPFTETFDNSSENWANATGSAFLDHFASGGPNGAGDGYASGTFNFVAAAPEADLIVARGQDEFSSSGNAFVGDYLAAGITELSFDVRHDLPAPANFFTRVTPPGNFPGAVGLEFAPVLPNTWTTITIAIDPANPQFVTFESGSFGGIFSNVGHVQVGVRTPAAVSGVDNDFTFDIDNVSIIPTPGAAGALAMGGLVLMRRRRG
jgi:hypothetical protein